MKVGDKVFVQLKNEDFNCYGVIVSIRSSRWPGYCNIKVQTGKLYGEKLAKPSYIVPCMESELTLCK